MSETHPNSLHWDPEGGEDDPKLGCKKTKALSEHSIYLFFFVGVIPGSTFHNRTVGNAHFCDTRKRFPKDYPAIREGSLKYHRSGWINPE